MSRVKQTAVRFSCAALTRRPVALGVMVTAFLCILLGGRDAAVAQTGFSEADKEMLRNYQLTIPKTDKLEAVARKLVAAAKADPQIRKEMEAVNGNVESIGAIADKLSRLAPHFTAVLKAEGTDPREFIVGVMSATLASMAVEARGTAGVADVLDFLPAGNIAFAEKHKPRLEYLSKVLSEWDKVDQAQ